MNNDKNIKKSIKVTANNLSLKEIIQKHRISNINEKKNLIELQKAKILNECTILYNKMQYINKEYNLIKSQQNILGKDYTALCDEINKLNMEANLISLKQINKLINSDIEDSDSFADSETDGD